MLSQIASLIRAADRKADGYSRDLQTARLRASYQRAYFAPALFNLIPVKTELIGSMAVDAYWRLYYNDAWLATHSVEENAALLIHEVSHLLRDHEARKKAAAVTNARLWNTAADCEINDDLVIEGLPLPGDPPLPGKYGLPTGETAELYYKELSTPKKASQDRRECDCGSGAHGDRRPWELPPDEETSGGTPGVDAVKAEMVRRDVAQRIMDISGLFGEVPLGWQRWAHGVMTPKVDYLAIIRRTVRTALRESTLGRYDRTYRRPHRRHACYGKFIMPSFYQPRPRPGFLIDTSSSMENTQLSRAMTELAALTRQLGYVGEVVVACCDAAVHGVKKVFNPSQVELYGGGGTSIGQGLEWFVKKKSGPIDLLIMVTDCQTEWPPEIPPFPVITIRVGDGLPPPWGTRGANKMITIEDRSEQNRARAGAEETMAEGAMNEITPWRRRSLTIPPDSLRAWVHLAVWEIWMGMLLSGFLAFGVALLATSGDRIITAEDLSGCYAPPPVTLPCDRIVYRTGALNAAFTVLGGMLSILIGLWFMWELWDAVAPKPITDDFLKLLNYSFGRNWRDPRTWPWSRMLWAYGFTFVGAVLVAGSALLIWTAVSFSRPVTTPVVNVETSQDFRMKP